MQFHPIALLVRQLQSLLDIGVFVCRKKIPVPRPVNPWRISSPGDYLVIDPDRNRIDRAEIVTDEEPPDPKVVEWPVFLGCFANRIIGLEH